MSISSCEEESCPIPIAPFGDAYEKIGTIQRRLAWPLHKDDTLFQSGRPTGLNIYFFLNQVLNYSTVLNTMLHCMFQISFLCRSRGLHEGVCGPIRRVVSFLGVILACPTSAFAHRCSSSFLITVTQLTDSSLNGDDARCVALR